jgi:hypothetical protein
MNKWEKGKESIFDEIKQDDFVFSFFPCIRFENRADMMIQGHNYPDIYKPMVDRLDISREREKYMVWILLPLLRDYACKGCEMCDRESVFDRTLFAIWWIMCRSSCSRVWIFIQTLFICFIIFCIWRFDTNEP